MKFLKEDSDTTPSDVQQETQHQLSKQEAAVTRLQQRIRACRLCQEHGYIPQAHPLVSGRASDCIMVIGQAPGHRSVENDRPFSGPGGRILQKWLEQAGFPPGYLHEHCYLTSLTHCDPGKNPRGDGDRKPSPQEVVRRGDTPGAATDHSADRDNGDRGLLRQSAPGGYHWHLQRAERHYLDPTRPPVGGQSLAQRPQTSEIAPASAGSTF